MFYLRQSVLPSNVVFWRFFFLDCKLGRYILINDIQNGITLRGFAVFNVRVGPVPGVTPTWIRITLTNPHNEHPFIPFLKQGKVRFTWVFIIFRILTSNIDCWYSLEPPCRGGSNKYPQSIFGEKLRKLSQKINWKSAFLQPWKLALYYIGMLS